MEGHHGPPWDTHPRQWFFSGCSMVMIVDKVATCSYFLAMRAVGIKNLNSRLSEYVRMAAQGETILVTDRDKVVAELSPPRPERSPILADVQLADGVRKGWIRPPAIGNDTVLPETERNRSISEILNQLDHDRSDR